MSETNGQHTDLEPQSEPTSDPPDDTDALAAVAAAARAPALTSTTAAVRKPGRRRFPWIVPLIVASALGGLTFGYFRWYAPRAAMLRVQDACLADNPPADTVVYDELPARAAEILARGGEFAAVPTATENSGPPIAGRIPTAWREMRQLAAPQLSQPHAAVVFLHERQTQAGVRGLVCVEADRVGRQLRITFVRPGAVLFEPVLIDKVVLGPAPQEGLVILNTGGDPLASKFPPENQPAARSDLRIFAGQPDVNDITHFTIPYEHDGRRGIFDMWVQDEQTVHYTERRFAPTK